MVSVSVVFDLLNNPIMRGKLKYTFYCLLLATGFAFAVEDWDQGYVLLVEKNFVYIDLGKNHDLEEGHTCYVYENQEVLEHSLTPVARLEVLEVYDFGALTTVKEVDPGKSVHWADLVSAQQIVQTPDSIGVSNQPMPDLVGSSDYVHPRRRKSKPFAWTLLATGTALGIGTYYSDQYADNSFEMYNQAQTAAKADHFKSRTQQLDRQTRILAGAAIVGVATSAILFLIRDREATPSVQTSFRHGGDGLSTQVQFSW